MPSYSDIQPAVKEHEFQNEDRTGAHRLVATSMLVTALIVAIKQGWWKETRNFVAEKTHGSAAITPPGGGSSTSSPTSDASAVLKWLLGLGGTWVILTLMVDLGDTADLAVALSLVIMGSVVIEYGPDAFSELGLTTPAVPGGKSATRS